MIAAHVLLLGKLRLGRLSATKRVDYPYRRADSDRGEQARN